MEFPEWDDPGPDLLSLSGLFLFCSVLFLVFIPYTILMKYCYFMSYLVLMRFLPSPFLLDYKTVTGRVGHPGRGLSAPAVVGLKSKTRPTYPVWCSGGNSSQVKGCFSYIVYPVKRLVHVDSDRRVLTPAIKVFPHTSDRLCVVIFLSLVCLLTMYNRGQK